jgi:ABC-2 type transport system ATP-binding protein
MASQHPATRTGLARKIALAAILLALLAAAVAWLPSKTDAATCPSNAAGIRVCDPVRFAMDDGATLEGSLFLPEARLSGNGPKLPLVVLLHGWGENRHRAGLDDAATTLALDGYAVLTYDARGHGNSDGNAAVASKREIKDLHLLMRLMVENRLGLSSSEPAYDGARLNARRIGVAGISYGGGQSFLASAANWDSSTYVLDTPQTGNPLVDLDDPVRYPKVAAAVPIVGWTDLMKAIFPDGTFKMTYDLALLLGSLDDQTDPAILTWAAKITTGVGVEDVRRDMAERSVMVDGALVNPDPATNSLFQVPLYIIQAWEDYLFVADHATSLYEAISAGNPNVRLYLGNTGHPPANADVTTAEAGYILDQAHAWFDLWLQRDSTQASRFQTAVEVAAEPPDVPAGVTKDTWSATTEKYPDFPAPGTSELRFFLRSGNRLAADAPGAELPDIVVNDPVNGLPWDPILSELAEGTPFQALRDRLRELSIDMHDAGAVASGSEPLKPGFVRYESEPLAAPVHVLGQPALDIWARTTSTRLQLAVLVWDVAPDGSAQLVTRGIRRITPVLPGELVRVDLSAFGDHHQYAAGHRIRIELAANDSPFFAADPTNASTQILHETLFPSSVGFPVTAPH